MCVPSFCIRYTSTVTSVSFRVCVLSVTSICSMSIYPVCVLFLCDVSVCHVFVYYLCIVSLFTHLLCLFRMCVLSVCSGIMCICRLYTSLLSVYLTSVCIPHVCLYTSRLYVTPGICTWLWVVVHVPQLVFPGSLCLKRHIKQPSVRPISFILTLL